MAAPRTRMQPYAAAHAAGPHADHAGQPLPPYASPNTAAHGSQSYAASRYAGKGGRDIDAKRKRSKR